MIQAGLFLTEFLNFRDPLVKKQTPCYIDFVNIESYSEYSEHQ